MSLESGNMRTFDGSAEAICVRTGETFALVLPARGAAGYTGQVQADERYLVLLTQRFELGDKVPGAAGRERLVFRAVRAGQCRLKLAYGRAWERESSKHQIFTVDIEDRR